MLNTFTYIGFFHDVWLTHSFIIYTSIIYFKVYYLHFSFNNMTGNSVWAGYSEKLINY